MMKEHPVLTNSKPVFTAKKEKINEILEILGEPHLQSFDRMLSNGLALSVANILPIYFHLPSGEKIVIRIEDASISRPRLPLDTINVRSREIYPTECRQRSVTYKGLLHARIVWDVDGIQKPSIDADLGEVPVMLRSKACNLYGKSPSQLQNAGEHENEWGGYFIVKGNEKLIRMLLMTRRNYPVAVQRSTWKERGKMFTESGILVRTAREDHVSFNNVLHYLSNGTAKLMFSQMKFLFYIPICLILKSLVSDTDEKVFQRLVDGFVSDQYYVGCVQNMLRDVHEEGLHTQIDCKQYLGKMFRQKFPELPSWYKDVEIADYILDNRILIHLKTHEDKFNLLIFMVQKLFQVVQDKAKNENIDGVMMQEVLVAGHLYQKYLTERLEVWLKILKKVILKKCSSSQSAIAISDLRNCIKLSGGVGKAIESFLATGNAPSMTGMGLMQSSGLVIMAENINRMRYMSHFRAVHRGSFFTTMRTTEARQLLPDAWGFICPVHTPDGTPCGLLNHLTVNCKISDCPDEKLLATLPNYLVEFGMVPLHSAAAGNNQKAYIVLLEGRVLGHIRYSDATRTVEKLRVMKVEGKIPEMTEIVHVPFSKNGQFPGIFIFIGPARMMRPVRNLSTGKIEYIGTFEQVYMDIAIDVNEIYPNVTTHLELSKTDFMSNLANLIPMPDCNQSPRNMYQCQMGKQTMGTPCHNFNLQAQNKLYRLQTPGTPLFRPVHHDNIELDDFAMGVNAIVAVISYTGYDMEDAMIINKSAYERGFAHGSIIKSHFYELTGTSYFARSPHMDELASCLDNDGLPHPGTKLTYKCPLYCYYDTDEAVYKVVKNGEKEDAFVDNIRYCGDFRANPPKIVCITIRIPRNPSVGDKFASRAGQKGICSQKYPAEDLPFTETGLIPDIVFNPHGFPSRMTIAMMIETMAGKSASVHGLVHDATPFRFSEKHTAIDYFGQLLEKGGYNYYGTERMYSGVDGRELNADIFFGVVHYQRLRHMVSDKWQVRSTGPVDAITHQPIKGRKRGGGVRFGEMERDSLISHGASFLLQDRLLYCSDKTLTLVCYSCGTLLGPVNRIIKRSNRGLDTTPATCRLCNNSSNIAHIEVPHVFKYLASELNSVNIDSNLKLLKI